MTAANVVEASKHKETVGDPVRQASAEVARWSAEVESIQQQVSALGNRLELAQAKFYAACRAYAAVKK